MFGFEMHFLSHTTINLVTTVSEIFRKYYSERNFKVVIYNNTFLTQTTCSGRFIKYIL